MHSYILVYVHVCITSICMYLKTALARLLVVYTMNTCILVYVLACITSIYVYLKTTLNRLLIVLHRYRALST